MVKVDVKAIAGWCFLNFASSYSFFLFHPYPFWHHLQDERQKLRNTYKHQKKHNLEKIWSHDLKDADDFPKIPQAALTGRAWAAEGGTTSTAAALKAGPGTWGMLSDWWANQQNGDL
jgi:hypothetical protein